MSGLLSGGIIHRAPVYRVKKGSNIQRGSGEVVQAFWSLIINAGRNPEVENRQAKEKP